MAFTLGFHIILASLGVALPLLMLIANYRGLRRDDQDALRLARRWSKVVAVTFAVGAVTGTVLSFEFGLLWPAFTGRFGEVFGVLFAIEGVCFFLEGDLRRDLHLRLEAADAVDAFLGGRAASPAIRRASRASCEPSKPTPMESNARDSLRTDRTATATAQ